MKRNSQPTEWRVITGAPGAGKSTIIETLSALGYRVQQDTARHIIQAKLAKGARGPRSRSNEASHRQRVLAAMLREAAQLPRSEMIFFDYGLPDNLAFARLAGLAIGPELRNAAHVFRYKQIFLLAPLPLRTPDPVRVENHTAQLLLDKLIRDVYLELGYRVVEIPALPVDERLKQILHHLEV